MVRRIRNACLGACLILALATTGCSGDTENNAVRQPSVSTTSPPSGAGSPGSTDKPTDAPTSAASKSPKAAPTTKDQPVPKVQRGGSVSNPTVTAKPTSIGGEVEYDDGVSLSIVDVDFDEETEEGPGAFPGREYAIITLQVANSSKQNLSTGTVVVTVLDNKDAAVAPVYVAKAKVKDFAGTVKSGKAAKARYAFALPEKSRSKVTVIVDFDGVHTSAVFRGKLS